MEKKSKSLDRIKNMIEERVELYLAKYKLTPSQYFDRLYWIFTGIMDYVDIENAKFKKMDEEIREAINKVRQMERLVEAIENVLKKEV